MKAPIAAILLVAGLCPAQAEDLSFAFEGDALQRERLKDLQGSENPPALNLKGWMNSEPLRLDQLKGKVVVLDFWATTCGPCLRSLPKINRLAKKYGDKVVFIGICHPHKSDQMAAVAKKHEIRFPIAVDADGATDKAYKVDDNPDYYLIDQTGKLVVADCDNDQLEAVIDKLLK